MNQQGIFIKLCSTFQMLPTQHLHCSDFWSVPASLFSILFSTCSSACLFIQTVINNMVSQELLHNMHRYLSGFMDELIQCCEVKGRSRRSRCPYVNNILVNAVPQEHPEGMSVWQQGNDVTSKQANWKLLCEVLLVVSKTTWEKTTHSRAGHQAAGVLSDSAPTLILQISHKNTQTVCSWSAQTSLMADK